MEYKELVRRIADGFPVEGVQPTGEEIDAELERFRKEKEAQEKEAQDDISSGGN
jgi:hypothetical protein